MEKDNGLVTTNVLVKFLRKESKKSWHSDN